jgi:hypothetical protein
MFMAQLKMEMPHKLGSDEAARRLKDKFSEVYVKFGSQVSDIKEDWVDHTLNFGFKTMGMGISGIIKVEDSAVNLTAELPLAAAFFKSAIEDRIRQELGGLLN